MSYFHLLNQVASGGGASSPFATYSRIQFFRKYPLPPNWTAIVGASQAWPGLLTKTASSGWGNAGAVSVQGFARDCRFAYLWRAPFGNNKMIGISTDQSCSSF